MERLSPNQQRQMERDEQAMRLHATPATRSALKARILASALENDAPTLSQAARARLKSLAHNAYLEAPAHLTLSAKRKAALHRIPQRTTRIFQLSRWSSTAAACLLALLWWTQPPTEHFQPLASLQPLPALPVVNRGPNHPVFGLKTSQTTVPLPSETPVLETAEREAIALSPLDPLPAGTTSVELPAAELQVNDVLANTEVKATPAFDLAIRDRSTPAIQQALHRSGHRLLVRTRGRFGWEIPEESKLVKFRLHVGRLHWTAAK